MINKHLVRNFKVYASVLGFLATLPVNAMDASEQDSRLESVPKLGVTASYRAPTLEQIFGDKAPIINTIIERENPIIPVPATNLRDSGFNQTYLTDAHLEELSSCRGKEVFEMGPGSGYFTAKLLAAGAKLVAAAEQSEGAREQMKRTLIKYKGLLGGEVINLKEKTLLGKDVFEAIITFKRQSRSFDLFVCNLVLHYQTPSNSLRLLREARSIAKPQAEFWGIVDMPCGLDVDPYLEAKVVLEKTEGPYFPGYVVRDREDVAIFQELGDGCAQRISPQRTQFVKTTVLPFDAAIEPLELWHGSFRKREKHDSLRKGTPVSTQVGLVNADGTFVLKHTLHQSMCLFDEETARRALIQTGWSVGDLFYIDETRHRVDSYDPMMAKAGKIYKLVFKAIASTPGTVAAGAAAAM